MEIEEEGRKLPNFRSLTLLELVPKGEKMRISIEKYFLPGKNFIFKKKYLITIPKEEYFFLRFCSN